MEKRHSARVSYSLSTICLLQLKCNRGGFGELILPQKLQAPQIETWNPINKWSFGYVYNIQPPRTN